MLPLELGKNVHFPLIPFGKGAVSTGFLVTPLATLLALDLVHTNIATVFMFVSAGILIHPASSPTV